MNITDVPSPNFGDRKDGKKPYILMLHYTDSKDTQQAIDILKTPAREVSAHYVVGDDGTIIRMVPEDKRAWHAGKSFWDGETDLNSASIGIEVQNTGHTFGYQSFPMRQMEAVRGLCRDIIARHGIKPHHVLAHSDVAPDRKIDPGILFPWEWLAGQGVGLMPGKIVCTEDKAEEVLWLLKEYGYDINVDQKHLITSFQRHYDPGIFNTPEALGVPSPRCLGILRWLMTERSKHR